MSSTACVTRIKFEYKLFLGQIFKGDFPFPFGIQHTGSVYGSMANDYPAIGVVGVLDMLFVFFLGQGKSPFL